MVVYYTVRSALRRPPRGHVTSVVALAVAALTFAACAPSQTALRKQLEPPSVPSVTVTAAIARTVPIYVEIVGQTEAVTSIQLKSQVKGTLQKVLFKEGSIVKQGQRLCVVDQAPYEASLLQAQGELEGAQANLSQALEQRQVVQAQTQLATAVSNLAQARQQVQLRQAQAQLAGDLAQLALAKKTVDRDTYLLKQGAIPQQQFDQDQETERTALATVVAQQAVVQNTALQQKIQIEQAVANVVSAKAGVHDAALQTQIGIQTARASVMQAQAGVQTAQINLGYTTIRAPVDGVVGVLQVSQGNFIEAGQVIDTLSTVNPMEAQFNVSELGYLRLAKQVGATPGGAAQARSTVFQLILPDNSLYPYPGTFKTVNRQVDQQTGTILVQALFPNPQGLLRPGLYVRVRATLEQRPNTVLVPQVSVQDVQGTKVVYVVGTDNKVSLRTITTEGTFGQAFIVLSGLAAGERVVVDGLQRVRPDIQVAPVEKPFPPLPEQPVAEAPAAPHPQ